MSSCPGSRVKREKWAHKRGCLHSPRDTAADKVKHPVNNTSDLQFNSSYLYTNNTVCSNKERHEKMTASPRRLLRLKTSIHWLQLSSLSVFFSDKLCGASPRSHRNQTKLSSQWHSEVIQMYRISCSSSTSQGKTNQDIRLLPKPGSVCLPLRLW